jgi:DNA repair protein RadD
MSLREYQARAITDTRKAYQAGHRAICIVAPTGAGKTVIGSTIACSAAEHERSVLWLAHRQELVEQARGKLPPDVRVTTVQALLASGDRPAADVVVLDEAHHYVADQWGEVANYYRDALRIGLTATPERSDGTPLGDLFTGLVVAAQYSELLEGGWIVPCELYAPERRHKTLSATVADAVDTYAHGRQTIVFSATVAEAKEAARDLLLHGAACVDGETLNSIRGRVVEDFRAGRVKIITNVYVFTEGFDAPNAAVCVLARGTSHASTYLQMVGRVLRPAPGKATATLVDLVGSCNDHGMPTDDREYSLTGTAIGRKGKRKPVLWQCKHCGMCLDSEPPKRRCPMCGQTMPEPEAIRVERRRLERRKINAVASPIAKAAAWDELQRTAAMRGYKRGWAAYKFKARFGHWPARV